MFCPSNPKQTCGYLPFCESMVGIELSAVASPLHVGIEVRDVTDPGHDGMLDVQKSRVGMRKGLSYNAATRLVTSIVRMTWPTTLSEDSVGLWTESLGAALANHKGFVSQRVLDLGKVAKQGGGGQQPSTQKQVIILKFRGPDSLLAWQVGL